MGLTKRKRKEKKEGKQKKKEHSEVHTHRATQGETMLPYQRGVAPTTRRGKQ